MEFLICGVNHRTASLEVREKLAITKELEGSALQALKQHLGQGVILSTCNRCEFYTLASESPVKDGVVAFISQYFHLPVSQLSSHLYAYRGEECVRHLFRVSSGLDSMILGESQVLGQVRDAFAAATEAKAVRGPLSRLFHHAMRVGKQVRRETGLGRNAMSVSRACVELARSVLGDLKERKVLVIGAGEAGKLAASALVRAGVKDILVANRTYQRGLELARELGGQAMPFEDIRQALAMVDAVIGSIEAQGFILGLEDVASAMESRPEKPLFLMDIALPRNFDPAAKEIPGVFLYDMDDLEEVAQAHRQEREEEATKAEEIIAREVQLFMAWWHSLEMTPTIAALRHHAETIRQRELAKALKKLPKLTSEEQESLDALTRAIVNKLLHRPVTTLKERRNPHHLQVARELFNLEER